MGQHVGSKILLVSLTIQNVDYSSLIAKPDLVRAVKRSVTESIITKAGHDIRPDQVNLTLRPGSVAVEASVTALAPSIKTVASKLDASQQSLCQAVAGGVWGVEGISSVTSGQIIVNHVVVKIHQSAEQNRLDSGKTSHGTPNISMILRGLVYFIVAVGGVSLLVAAGYFLISRCWRNYDGYKPAEQVLVTESSAALLTNENTSVAQSPEPARKRASHQPKKLPKAAAKSSTAPKAAAQAAPTAAAASTGAPTAEAADQNQVEQEAETSPLPKSDAAAAGQEADDAFLQLASDMGFNEKAARIAFQQENGDAEAAMERLFGQAKQGM